MFSLRAVNSSACILILILQRTNATIPPLILAKYINVLVNVIVAIRTSNPVIECRPLSS